MDEGFDEALRSFAFLLTKDGAPRAAFLTRQANGDVVVSLVSVTPEADVKVPYARVARSTGKLTLL